MSYMTELGPAGTDRPKGYGSLAGLGFDFWVDTVSPVIILPGFDPLDARYKGSLSDEEVAKLMALKRAAIDKQKQDIEHERSRQAAELVKSASAVVQPAAAALPVPKTAKTAVFVPDTPTALSSFLYSVRPTILAAVAAGGGVVGLAAYALTGSKKVGVAAAVVPAAAVLFVISRVRFG